MLLDQDKLDGIILTNGMIEDRCAKLAYDLYRDYGNNRIHLLCVLKVRQWFQILIQGAQVFFAALTHQLQNLGMAFSYDFIKVKSYDGANSTGDGNLLVVSMKCSESGGYKAGRIERSPCGSGRRYY